MELLSVHKLEREFSPFETDIWECGDVVSAFGVSLAIDEDRLMPPELAIFEEKFSVLYHVRFHEERIAWLVVHGWNEPVEIDFGISDFQNPWWPVIDGNHRLAAAIYRGDSTILADCAGEVGLIRRYAARDTVCKKEVPCHS